MISSTRRPPRWQVVGTGGILLLSAVAILLGFRRPGHYRDTEYFLAQIVGQDVVTAILGIPLLGVGLWLASRGSLRGQIIWIGALGYMLYTWASYALMLSFNEFFLGYVALFGLSLFVFVGALLDLDAVAVSDRIGSRLPDRLYAGYLLAMAVFIAAGWLAEIIPATLHGTVPESIVRGAVPTSVIYVLDLGVLLPGVVLVALWIRQQRIWGYVFVGVILVKFATLGLAVLAMEYWLMQTGQGGSTGMMAVFGTITVLSAALGGYFLQALGTATESDLAERTRSLG